MNPKSHHDLNKKYSSIAKVKAPKTYYNIYENNSHVGGPAKTEETSLYNSRTLWRKPKYSTKTESRKNYPVYTQLAFHKSSNKKPKALKTDTINGFT